MRGNIFGQTNSTIGIPMDKNIIERLEALENRNIITVGLSDNFEIPTAGENTVALNKIIAQVGDKFSVQNGKIYIVGEISHVKISGNCMLRNISAVDNSALNFAILKNGTAVEEAISSTSTATVRNNPRSLGTKLVEVQQGDCFELSIYGKVGDTLNSSTARTYITLEAV